LPNNILGIDYYFNDESINLIFGKFNSEMENKILVVVNETSGKDTFNLNENIKAAITAKENIIEHKGLKPYKNNNNVANSEKCTCPLRIVQTFHQRFNRKFNSFSL
jgi:hypothetical protein